MPPHDKPVSRREFARNAALTTAALLVHPDLNRDPAAVALPATASSDRPAPAQATTSASNLSPQSQAEADSRYQTIVAQYPDRFSDAQRTDLKRLCVAIQPPLDRIRAYSISNGDLPALYLKPLVDRDKKPTTPGKP